MALPAAGVVGGRDGGQPVTGGARGSARAAARRVPQVQRRSCQLGDARVPPMSTCDLAYRCGILSASMASRNLGGR